MKHEIISTLTILLTSTKWFKLGLAQSVNSIGLLQEKKSLKNPEKLDP